MLKIFAALTLLFSSLSLAGGNQWGQTQMTSPTITGTSTQLLAFNPSRCYLLIQNNGATSIIVKLGSVQSGTEGVVIISGGNWEPPIAPINSVWAESASSTDAATVIEGKCL